MSRCRGHCKRSSDGNFCTHSARQPQSTVFSRRQPDTDEGPPNWDSPRSEALLAVWQVQDSNLRRRRPTDLQFEGCDLVACGLSATPRTCSRIPPSQWRLAVASRRRSDKGCCRLLEARWLGHGLDCHDGASPIRPTGNPQFRKSQRPSPRGLTARSPLMASEQGVRPRSPVRPSSARAATASRCPRHRRREQQGRCGALRARPWREQAGWPTWIGRG
jgi:hypothetical protein